MCNLARHVRCHATSAADSHKALIVPYGAVMCGASCVAPSRAPMVCRYVSHFPHSAGNYRTTQIAYVGDVVRGLVNLVNCPDAVGNIFNIGNDHEVTINDLANRIVQMTESTSSLTYIPYDQVYGEGFVDMQRRAPDLAKIRRVVGYRTTKDLDDVIRLVVDHARRP